MICRINIQDVFDLADLIIFTKIHTHGCLTTMLVRLKSHVAVCMCIYSCNLCIYASNKSCEAQFKKVTRCCRHWFVTARTPDKQTTRDLSLVYCLSNRATDRAEPTGIATALNAQICQPCVILLLHLKCKKSVYSIIFRILVELKSRRTPVFGTSYKNKN
jgi:hypothetical protein